MSFSALFHLVCFQVLSMLYNVLELPSFFKAAQYSTTCIYHFCSSIHLSMVTWVASIILGIMNNAAMNNSVQLSLQDPNCTQK